MTPRALLIAFVFSLFASPVLFASAASAQTGFYLPVAPTSYGQDEFRAADGTTCRSSMDGTKRIELGAFGSGGRTENDPYSLPGYSYPNQGNAGVYGRFSMSLDASPERMNCNALYKMELERRALELELMKRSLVEADHRLDELKQSRADDPDATASAPAPVRAVAARPLAPAVRTGSGARSASAAKTAAGSKTAASSKSAAGQKTAASAAPPGGAKAGRKVAARSAGGYPPP